MGAAIEIFGEMALASGASMNRNKRGEGRGGEIADKRREATHAVMNIRAATRKLSSHRPRAALKVINQIIDGIPSSYVAVQIYSMTLSS